MAKVSKVSVNYREFSSRRRCCGNCVMFSKGTCDLVAGKIESDHVCDKWAAKK